MARRFRMPPDDAEGVALEALVEAARKFDPAKGTFKAYANRVIAGRIADAKRQEDILSRHERDRQRDGYGAPTRRRVRLTPSSLRVLGTPASQDMAVDHARTMAKVKALLSPRLLTVVEMTAEGKTLKQIGAHLGVSEARACQLLKEAKERGKQCR